MDVIEPICTETAEEQTTSTVEPGDQSGPQRAGLTLISFKEIPFYSSQEQP